MQQIVYTLLIGLVAGTFSGIFGIGGASLMIPALIFFLGFSQHQAQGTSLAAMLPPVGILAAIKYYQGGNIAIDVALYCAIGFVVGGFIGAMFVQPIPDYILRRAFAVYMIALGVRMLF